MSRLLLDNLNIRRYLNERVLCEVDTSEKRVALTFDDGPNPRNTPALLRLLEAKGLNATFFVVGKRVSAFPEIAQETVAAGHELGNHTYNHYPLTLLPRGVVRRELERTTAIVAETCGIQTMFMRPPLGWFNRIVLGVANTLRLRPVIGSVYPEDSKNPGERTIVERVMRRVHDGAIIIMHDGGWQADCSRSQTLSAFDRITDQLLEDGVQMGTLSSLIASKA